MFRVFDTEQRKWIKENVYLNSNGELFLIERSLFGKVKTPMILSQDRYTYHRAIDLWDKNQAQVFEGDYILARVSEDKYVVGMVAFAAELSAYVILCVDSDEFYTLGSSVSEEIAVIGNVFDGHNWK